MRADRVSVDWVAVDWVSVDHMTDPELSRDLSDAANQERRSTAYILPRIAEADRRKLYLAAGYPSMHAYCTGRLHYSDDAASKRIQAARKAREIPALFIALGDGRLHLTAICMLAPHLTAENADELITAATHRRKWEIREWVRRRFAQPDLLASRVVEAQAAHAPAHTGPGSNDPDDGADAGSAHPGESHGQHAPAHIVESAGGTAASSDGTVGSPVPDPAEATPSTSTPVDPTKKEALAPALVLVAQTAGPGIAPDAPAHVEGAPSWAPSSDWTVIRIKVKEWKLRHARELMSHVVPSGSASLIYDRAIDLLIRHQEKRKFGLTTAPRAPRPGSLSARCVPARVRRAVWERDGGQCTFVGENGNRCESREFLEFDHIDPVARGGRATVDRIRLRCRGHNQYEAEQAFGAAFMQRKREEARRARAEKARKRDPGA